MDLRLNTMRRSINLSVYLVFNLEAGRFKILCENLVGAGGFHFPSLVAHSHLDFELQLNRTISSSEGNRIIVWNSGSSM